MTYRPRCRIDHRAVHGAVGWLASTAVVARVVVVGTRDDFDQLTTTTAMPRQVKASRRRASAMASANAV
jgi:mannose/fructose/N-acetylgalactosamine-specific phosphotransferase system component IIB